MKVIYRDTKTMKEYDDDLMSFFTNDYDAMRSAEEEFQNNEFPFSAFRPEIGDEHDDYNDRINDYAKEAGELFVKNFKENWNRYSPSWPSPRGVEPLFMVLKVVDRIEDENYVIEASDDTHPWDTDYVGSSQGLNNINIARERMIELCADSDWAGWSFRLYREVGGNILGELIDYGYNLLPVTETKDEE